MLESKNLIDGRADSRKVQASILVAIVIAGIILRIVVAFYLGDSVPPGKDETSYSVLASRLAGSYGYSFPTDWYPFTQAGEPTAHWSFLYTALVAGVYAALGVHPLAVRLLGALLGGILLPWMVYRLSRRLLPAQKNVAIVAAACAALYAYFILYAARVLTETFFITAVLWSLERSLAVAGDIERQERPGFWPIVGLGASLGIATLLRQSILPWVVMLFLWLLWIGFNHKRLGRAIGSVFLTGLILVLFILPFTIRNYLAYDSLLLLNSNAGFAMYSAQHPLHNTNFQAFTAAPLPDNLEKRPENEAEWDRLLMRQGIAFILEDPGRYVLLSFSRIADYFMFWPSPETSAINNAGRVLSFALFLPVMIYGLWISRADWRQLQLAYLFILFYSVLHIFTWAMIRYRLPVDAVCLIFAAIGLIHIAGKLDHIQLINSFAIRLHK